MAFELRAQFPAAAQLGEAPLWLPSQRAFLWLDLLGREVHRLDPARCEDQVIADGFAENLACLVRLTEGDVLLVTATRFFRLDPDTGATSPVAAPLVPPDGTCFNDGKVAPDGSLWLGISDAAEIEPTGSLHRISATGVQCVDRGFVIANGPAFSPDGTVAYFADSVGRSVVRYLLNADGTPGERTLLARLPEEAGLPDGMTTDRDGRLYSAHWAGGRITVYNRDGKIADVITVPAVNVTSCAFGGEDCSLLFVTSASLEENAEPESPHGDVFVMSGSVAGLPEPLFDFDLLR